MAYHVKDSNDFEEKLKTNLLVVVDFFATWCGPCRMIAPTLEKFATDMSAKLIVLKVDVDECEDLASKYEISSMPTFLFIKNGEKVDSFSGASAEKLEKFIVQYTSDT